MDHINVQAAVHVPRASSGARVLAACIGVVTLAIAAFFTAGGALVAPLGMLVSRLMMRRQHKTPTFTSSWLGAVGAVSIALLIAGGIVIARAPRRVFADAQRSMDSSAAAAREHPPKWLRRMSGPVPTAPRFSPRANWALAVWGAVVGGLLVCVLMGSVIGTVGWGASLPLAYAITGRWPARRQVEADVA